ncbi:MAG TPA: S8 family serine peptidase, partial [Candidatus Aquicultoraceae bacterium]|nr:S8 family serine peptidase [Candidatus Aquicultoraceae bacterium]
MRIRGSRRPIALVPFALLAALSLSGAEVSPDLRKIDPAVVFRADAAAAAPLGPPGADASKFAPLSVFIRLAADDDALPDQVRNLGGTAWKVLPRIWAAALPADGPRYLSNRPTVRYIEPDRVARPMLDLSRPAVEADYVQQGSFPLPRLFRGEGTFVGLVDTGIDGDHPDFTGRIAHTFAASGLNPVQDTNGHGTHVTGIAAGNGAASGGTYTGMAPGASILAGRAGRNDFQTSDILATINNLLQFAGATPVAINLSLGLTHGPHDGTSLFESEVDSLAAGAAGSKRIITVAAGNERGGNEHFHATVPPFGLITLDVSFAAGTTNAEVEIWADGEDEYSVTATIGTDTLTVPSRTSGSSGRISLLSNKVSSHPNGDTLISAIFLPLAGTPTATVQLRRTRNGGTGTVDAYVDRTLDGTLQNATDTGIVTEPANAEN